LSFERWEAIAGGASPSRAPTRLSWANKLLVPRHSRAAPAPTITVCLGFVLRRQTRRNRRQQRRTGQQRALAVVRPPLLIAAVERICVLALYACVRHRPEHGAANRERFEIDGCVASTSSCFCTRKNSVPFGRSPELWRKAALRERKAPGRWHRDTVRPVKTTGQTAGSLLSPKERRTSCQDRVAEGEEL
jgi:hypothetical protein